MGVVPEALATSKLHVRVTTISQDKISFIHHTYTSSIDNRILTHAKRHTHLLLLSRFIATLPSPRRAVRPNPNTMPRTIPVLEYDELSTCPHAYPVVEAPYTPLSA